MGLYEYMTFILPFVCLCVVAYKCEIILEMTEIFHIAKYLHTDIYHLSKILNELIYFSAIKIMITLKEI